MTLFGSRDFADVISSSHTGLGWALSPMAGVIKKTGREEGQGIKEAEIGVKQLQAKECQQPLEAQRRNRLSPQSAQQLSRIQLFPTPWTAAHHASLSITNSQSLLMSIQSVMPFNHPILCRPLLLSPSIFLSIRVFSNESVLHIR